jgi:hypothetical protein
VRRLRVHVRVHCGAVDRQPMWHPMCVWAFAMHPQMNIKLSALFRHSFLAFDCLRIRICKAHTCGVYCTVLAVTAEGVQAGRWQCAAVGRLVLVVLKCNCHSLQYIVQSTLMLAQSAIVMQHAVQQQVLYGKCLPALLLLNPCSRHIVIHCFATTFITAGWCSSFPGACC